MLTKFKTGIISLAVIIIMIMMLSSCNFSQKTCKRLYNESKDKTFDMVIVPGVPLIDGKWDRIMKGRVYWVKFLYEKGIAKNIMFSGSAVYSPYYEAEVMALYAEALGIPKQHIFTETKAEHSTENIYYSYKKAKLLKYNSFALASDPFQTKLLRRFARKKVSADIKLIPFITDTLKLIDPTMTDPEIDYKKAYLESFIGLPQRESFWKRFRGTRGLNINKQAYNN